MGIAPVIYVNQYIQNFAGRLFSLERVKKMSEKNQYKSMDDEKLLEALKGKLNIFPQMAELLVQENQELKAQNAELTRLLEAKTKELKTMKTQVLGTLGLLAEYTEDGEEKEEGAQ